MPEILSEKENDFILKGTSLNYLKEFSGEVKVQVKDTRVIFYSEPEQLSIAIAKMPGGFIDIDKMISIIGERKAVFDVEQLLGALKRVEVSNVNPSENYVILNIKDNKIKVMNKNEIALIEESLDKCKAEFSEELKVFFDNKLLIQALQKTDSDIVTILFSSAVTPISIKGEGSTAIVVPVRK